MAILSPSIDLDLSNGALVSRFTDVNGISVHARLSEHPVRAVHPPVVLVHGLAVSSRYMVPLATRLAKTGQVYAPDLPGYGLSEHPPGPLDVPRLAHLLKQWMDAIHLESAVVVANSFGCQIAARFAADYPSRAQGLVLLGPMVDPRARSVPTLAARWLAGVPIEPRELGAILARDLLDMGLPRLVNLFAAMMTDRIEDVLPRVLAPTLIVRGERDRMVSQSWAEEVAQLPGNGQLVVLPNVAHSINYSAPLEVAQLVQSLASESALRLPRPVANTLEKPQLNEARRTNREHGPLWASKPRQIRAPAS